MKPKYYILDDQLKSHELNESRINSRLSLRKKNYNKIFNNKRMLISELETLFPQESVYNYDLLKILSNIQILKIIQNMNHQSLLDNRTELFQCLFSIYFNMNQNSNDTVVFINEKKNIHIFN